MSVLFTLSERHNICHWKHLLIKNSQFKRSGFLEVIFKIWAELGYYATFIKHHVTQSDIQTQIN